MLVTLHKNAHITPVVRSEIAASDQPDPAAALWDH